MKRIAITFLVVLVVLVAGALAVPQFMDWNAYRTRIADQIKDATGFELTIKGDLDLAILPYPRLNASDISLRSPRSKTPVLKLEQLSLDIAIMPLLRSRIEVRTMRLDNPILALKVLPDGKGNWMTDKLAGAGKVKDDHAQQKNGSTTPAAIYKRIGLENVTINNGTVRFIHSRNGREYALRDFHASIDAGTLSGPYNIDAQSRFQDKPLAASVKIGRYTGNKAGLPLKLTVNADESTASAKYSGVVDMSQGMPVLQGEFKVKSGTLEQIAAFAPDALRLPPDLAQNALSAKAMVTASTDHTRLKDMTMQLGAMQHSGHINMDYSDPDAIRIDTKLLPDGAEDAAKPGEQPWAALARTGVEGTAILKQSQYRLKETHIVTGDQRHSVQLAYDIPDSEGKPALDVEIDGDRLDLDALGLISATRLDTASGSSQGEDTDDSKSFVSSLAFLEEGVKSPLHIDANIRLDGIRAMGRDFSKPVMQFELRHNRLNVQNVSVNKAYGANWQLQGKLGDISKMNGLDMHGKMKTDDLARFVKALSKKGSDAYQVSGKGSAHLTLEGSLSDLDVVGNIKAMKMRSELSGHIQNPLSAPELASGSLRIRHPDSAELVKIVAHDYQAPQLLKNAVDVYARIAHSRDKGLTLKDISGRIFGTNIKGQISAWLDEPGKPALEGDLEFTQLDLDGLVQPGSGNGSGSGKDQEQQKKQRKGVAFSRKAIDIQALNAVNMDFKLSGRTLTYANWKLNAPEIKLRLQDGTLHIDKLKGELFSGSADLEGTIEAGINKGKGLAIDVKGAFRDVGARQFSNAMLGADLNVMDGGITLESELSTNGVSPAALALALNGQGSISSSDFVIHGIELNSLAHALRDDVSTQGAIDNLVRFMRSPFRGGETRFTDINGEFDIDKGVVSLNNTKLEAKGFVMTSKGTINLPRWKLDLMNTVSFPDDKNVPSFDIIVRGPLDEPARGLRDQMMRNFLEDRINNKARRFVTDELNKLFGGDLKTSPDSGDQNQKPDNSTGAADADKGQDGRAQRDNDSSTSGQTKQEGTGDQSIETIKPDNIKDNGSGHDDSKIERISPEDAVQGVIDRLNP